MSTPIHLNPRSRIDQQAPPLPPMTIPNPVQGIGSISFNQNHFDCKRNLTEGSLKQKK